MLGRILNETVSLIRASALLFLVFASVLFSISVSSFAYMKSKELVAKDDGDLWAAIQYIRQKGAECASDIEKLKKANVGQVDKLTRVSAKQRERGPMIEATSSKAGQALDRVVHLEGRVTKLEQMIPTQQKPWFGGPRR